MEFFREDPTAGLLHHRVADVLSKTVQTVIPSRAIALARRFSGARDFH